MSWSGEFLAALQVGRAPQFLLATVPMWHEPGTAWGIGSHPGIGDDLRIGMRGIDVQGCTLSPRGWSSSVGAWSVVLVGDIQTALAHLTRGTIVELRVGFSGWPEANFERVAIGQVRNVRGVAPVWTVEVLDLYSACRARLDTNRSLSTLFASVGSQTTVSTGYPYTVGDGNLKVDSTAGFEQESGGIGAVMCTPVSTGDDPFYISWATTRSAPERFVGLPSSAICATTAVDLAAGDTVTEVALLSGHPIDIARKVLVSRESGNGAYDVLPLGWGLGISDECLDHDDMDAFKALTPALQWDVIVTGSQDDGFEWLSGILAPAGMFLTVRQGRLTARGGVNTLTATPVGSLTDEEIEEIEEYEAFDAAHTPEYMYVSARTETALVGGAVTDAATLPAAPTQLYDLRTLCFTNEAAACTEVVARLEESGSRVPERLRIRTATLYAARWAAGDVITLTSLRTHSRRDGAAGFENRRALVTHVSARWVEGKTILEVCVYPETDDTFA